MRELSGDEGGMYERGGGREDGVFVQGGEDARGERGGFCYT